jgi:hypothetical protein
MLQTGDLARSSEAFTGKLGFEDILFRRESLFPRKPGLFRRMLQLL